MAAVDKVRLLAWLERAAADSRPVKHAIYAGLAARVRRGDFDEEGED